MTGLWQAALSGVAALGLHVAGFALMQVPAGGVQAAGDGGTALVTLAASDPGVAAMVATWDAPPAVADAPMAPVAPDVAPALAMPVEDLAPVMPTIKALPPVVAEAAPFVQDAPAPVPTTRPKARPVQQAVTEPAAKPKPAAEPRPGGGGTAGQVAAGTGGGTAAGSGGQAAAGTQSGAAVADQQAAWGASIRARIERKKRYPAGTTATGTVRLRLTVGVDGRLQALSIARSSGDAALDAAAVDAVQRAGRFARAPGGVSDAASFTLNVSFAR